MNKVVENGYVIAVTTANVGTEITESEYNAIMQKIHNKPIDPDGYNYMLRSDTLEWELVELPEPIEGEAEISDYENSLSDLGVRFGD